MKIKMINIMSALQLQETGHRFVHAMGPMIDDENMMSAVFAYIAALRSNHAPCQYSAQQVREFAAKAESESQMGTGMMSHQDFKQEVASWRK